MSKTPASKSSRSKGTLEGAWNTGRRKESPTHAKDDAEEEPLTKSELIALLKDFQVETQNTIKVEITALREDFQSQLDAMKNELQQMEERTVTCETTVQASASAHKQQQDDIAEIKKQNVFLFSKCEDLENRERRRNLRLRGVPEKTEGLCTEEWAVDFLHNLQPDLSKEDLSIERAHRIGPVFMGNESRPRDILIKFYSFQAKEKILQTARNVDRVLCGEQEISIFQDVAPSTLQRRAGLKPITKALIERGIRYRWTFPFGLAFEWNSKQRMVTTVAEGRKFLPEEMLGAEEETETSASNTKEGVPWPWTVVRSKPKPRGRQRPKEKEQSSEGETSGL